MHDIEEMDVKYTVRLSSENFDLRVEKPYRSIGESHLEIVQIFLLFRFDTISSGFDFSEGTNVDIFIPLVQSLFRLLNRYLFLEYIAYFAYQRVSFQQIQVQIKQKSARSFLCSLHLSPE